MWAALRCMLGLARVALCNSGRPVAGTRADICKTQGHTAGVRCPPVLAGGINHDDLMRGWVHPPQVLQCGGDACLLIQSLRCTKQAIWRQGGVQAGVVGLSSHAASFGVPKARNSLPKQQHLINVSGRHPLACLSSSVEPSRLASQKKGRRECAMLSLEHESLRHGHKPGQQCSLIFWLCPSR